MINLRPKPDGVLVSKSFSCSTSLANNRALSESKCIVTWPSFFIAGGNAVIQYLGGLLHHRLILLFVLIAGKVCHPFSILLAPEALRHKL